MTSASLAVCALAAGICCFGMAHGCQPPTNTRTLTTTTMPTSPSSSSDNPNKENSLDDAHQISRNVASYYSDNCEMVKITAITNKPYSDETVESDAAFLKQQVMILETFTGVKLVKFGKYHTGSIKYHKFFASEFVFTDATNHCDPLKDFATKAVSYSANIQKVYFSCGCHSPVEISKISSAAADI